MWKYNYTNELYHYGVLGMKWGKHSQKNSTSIEQIVTNKKKPTIGGVIVERPSKKKPTIGGVIVERPSKNKKKLSTEQTSKNKKKLSTGKKVAMGVLAGAGATTVADVILNRDKYKIGLNFARIALTPTSKLMGK